MGHSYRLGRPLTVRLLLSGSGRRSRCSTRRDENFEETLGEADVGGELHKKYGLPDVAQLLHDLNDARKSAAYGDIHNSRNLSGGALAQILRWPTERSREWICKFLTSAPANESILAVVAIGSAVRPNVSSDDLDLIVIAAEATPLQISPPIEVDLRLYSAAIVDAQIASGHDLLGWAVKFGRVLFQRDHYWDRMVGSWQDRLPLPSAALARERAAGAHERLVKVLEFGDADAAHEQAVLYLTHLARAELLDRGIYPASRPELASQLRVSSRCQFAEQLDRFLQDDRTEKARIDQLLQLSA